MRVLCIDGQRRYEDIGNEPLLEEWQVYDVETEVLGQTRQGKLKPCYKLAEVDFPHVYNVNRFVPCSDEEPVLEAEKPEMETAC